MAGLFLTHVATQVRPMSRLITTWRVRDSNPRSLRRLIYSQIPLATWVTRQGAPAQLLQSTGGAISNITIARRSAEIEMLSRVALTPWAAVSRGSAAEAPNTQS